LNHLSWAQVPECEWFYPEKNTRSVVWYKVTPFFAGKLFLEHSRDGFDWKMLKDSLRSDWDMIQNLPAEGMFRLVWKDPWNENWIIAARSVYQKKYNFFCKAWYNPEDCKVLVYYWKTFEDELIIRFFSSIGEELYTALDKSFQKGYGFHHIEIPKHWSGVYLVTFELAEKSQKIGDSRVEIRR
jgi:hypothetical protein